MNDSTIQLIVEIGTNRYALPKMSRELTGEDIRALVHYITQREVSLFYVKGIDQIVENHLTIYEMDLRNGDVLVAANDEQFIFQKQRASFVEKPQFNEPNHSSKKENDFDPIELVVEPGDELVDNYHIHNNNNNQQHGNRNYSLFKNSEVQKTEEEARQIVNLFHIISIICCIISLLVWFTELIPCAMIYFLFASIQVKHNLLSATLLVVDIIITAIVFSLFLALIIAGAVFSFGATLFFLLLLVPYVIVLSACCASLTCCRC